MNLKLRRSCISGWTFISFILTKLIKFHIRIGRYLIIYKITYRLTLLVTGYIIDISLYDRFYVTYGTV